MKTLATRKETAAAHPLHLPNRESVAEPSAKAYAWESHSGGPDINFRTIDPQNPPSKHPIMSSLRPNLSNPDMRSGV